ncbi:MAG TPA: UDP-N-acetylmuramoyl-L-alanyl-D-glutamate--2,6-diaminopimelate ligase [Chloroflexi bacterium]|nr:UDP-N-acetylmuramoyl-L-alanyl-D-glutamate--2,6-diaminopimelate ligase [Chloroflexota bacterium]HAL28873.1 UDP-N-acetylmuramoyl-L-alanyl-D-glutamate--2,6-diaminopimelate ligase [Chloroflexota bacterium]
MKLGALLSQARIPVPDGAADRDVRAIAYDSRKVKEGSLFVAIPGFHRDGIDFVPDAVKNGAIAVVAERKVRMTLPVAVVPDARAALADLAAEFFDHPTDRLRVAAVTGTDGKTTTVHLVSDVLEAAGLHTGYATTVDFKLADNEWQNDTRQSTQEALEIQEFCAELLVAGGTWGVLEATSHALALRKMRGIDVDLAIFTNLSPEHLDFHGTLQAYLEAKGILFEMLTQGRDKGVPKAAVLNADDPHWRYLADRAAGARLISYGIAALADVQATVTAADANGSRLKITAFGETVDLRLPLVGRFNAHNALAAIGAGLAAGATLAQCRDALARARPVRGRMDRIDAGQPFTVIVDYAHTPESLEKVLALLRPLTPGKLIAVFGSAGERDRTKRPKLAAAAAKYADHFVITQEDPRLEDPALILAEIEAGAVEAGKQRDRDYRVIDDRTEAINAAIAAADDGDTVLLAGKGHEGSIIVGEEKLPWDEAAVARAALRARGFAG